MAGCRLHSPRHAGGGDSTLRIEGSGPLLTQVLEVSRAGGMSNRVTHVAEGFAHGRFRAIPVRTLPEAVVNGVFHLDWLSTLPTTIIEQVGDTLTVTSPGGDERAAVSSTFPSIPLNDGGTCLPAEDPALPERTMLGASCPIHSVFRNVRRPWRAAWAFHWPMRASAKARTTVDLPEPLSPRMTCHRADSVCNRGLDSGRDRGLWVDPGESDVAAAEDGFGCGGRRRLGEGGGGLEAEHGAEGCGGVGDEATEAVVAGPHVADPPVLGLEQPFVVHHPLAVEDDADDEPEPEGADEEVAAPAGEAVPVVHREPRGSDGRGPLVDRLGHTFRWGPSPTGIPVRYSRP